MNFGWSLFEVELLNCCHRWKDVWRVLTRMWTAESLPQLKGIKAFLDYGYLKMKCWIAATDEMNLGVLTMVYWKLNCWIVASAERNQAFSDDGYWKLNCWIAAKDEEKPGVFWTMVIILNYIIFKVLNLCHSWTETRWACFNDGFSNLNCSESVPPLKGISTVFLAMDSARPQNMGDFLPTPWCQSPVQISLIWYLSARESP